jgi:hypothetical protein
MSETVVRPAYAFDGFRVDAQHRVLSRASGEPIPLAPRVTARSAAPRPAVEHRSPPHPSYVPEGSSNLRLIIFTPCNAASTALVHEARVKLEKGSHKQPVVN